MKNTLLTALIAATLTGCAMTYKQPDTLATTFSKPLPASKQSILAAAKRTLIDDGYQLTYADADAGIISTAPRNFRITPAQADCGTTMGIDYLKDNRTSSRLGYGISATEGAITIKANIESEYKPGDTLQNITLSCVSRGMLEAELFSKISAALDNTQAAK